ncbi:type II toxin-antitoxin system VapC family toxin [Geodermatophilus sabuli]|uniref:Ribonuclease VapC n=1 Tax=Geodermatophilus sabuli TaxID=1564158 RepID=A0A285EHG4_9ACTN|nr:type II toxin-antitoxin system VapC family toxin [Geodermatophilus sabuli]MBB3086704.1 putative nucleic acid-binding protein [Geodermatophilus sabuli]SNX97644.1 Predicted nucleic acid-binding protein, contains PIN domain [Geodermatophilus sabuli]
MTLVVDASAVLAALVDSGDEGTWVRRQVRGEALAAPGHLLVEVSGALRRAVLGGRLGRDVAILAHHDLVQLSVTSFPFEPLAPRVWALHPTVTAYAAAYVALAEELGAPLLTLDRRLARASGPACDFLLPA